MRFGAASIGLAVLAGVLAVAEGAEDAGAAGEVVCESVAWSGFDGNDREIFVAAPDGSDRMAITDDDDDDVVPSWSGDGRLAWVSGERNAYDLVVGDPVGFAQDVIASDAAYIDPHVTHPPAWSPDSSTLLFARADGVWWDRTVWTVAADGTDLSEVFVQDPELPRLIGTPAFVPNDDRVAAVTFGPDVGDILLARLDGSDESTLPVIGVDLAFSPDGGLLVWAGSPAPAEPSPQGVWVSALDGSGAVQLSENTSGRTGSPAWNPQGTRIAFVDAGQIVTVDPDGSNRVVISSVGNGSDPTRNEDPAWSPDGTQIAWAGTDADSTSQIYVADADGTNRVVISSGGPEAPTQNRFPTWGTAPRITITDRTERPALIKDQVFDVEAHCGEFSSLEIAFDPPSCFGPGEIVVSSGEFADRIWTLPTLEPGQTERLRHRGAVTTLGRCVTVAEVISSSPASVASATVGDECVSNGDPFLDVPEDSYASAHVRCLEAVGIVEGTSPTTYSPVEPVTREQMAALLARLWRAYGGDCASVSHPFVDVSEHSFAAADVACLFELGVTTGTSPSTFSPASSVTREQMAAFLGRLWHRIEGTECRAISHPFVDVSEDSFAAADVACLFELRVTTGTSPSTFSPGTAVTREQMAAFLGRLWAAAHR